MKINWKERALIAEKELKQIKKEKIRKAKETLKMLKGSYTEATLQGKLVRGAIPFWRQLGDDYYEKIF